MDFYIDAVEKALKGVRKEVIIRFCNFSLNSLERTFKAAAGCEKLTLSNCKFDLKNDLDFSVPAYAIKHLNLSFSGKNHDNDWENHPERLKKLFVSMSKSKLKDSLTEINITQCGVTEESVQAMVKELGLDNVTSVLSKLTN
uniref:Uncharacterized protein n=1 Tax=Euplotes harpa TaxID=151035 RepID=A0A7S3JF53_9SPIT|mmetsp:Transcript_33394/g.38347  ORF Transcript_33394/g.38347 Transcript_33394/m.38347 type:complete len:142 (+) Transcript_33394:1436-1861(+)